MNEDVPPVARTSFTARELLEQAFGEPKFHVDRLIPEGVTFLVGSPKVGKALALDTPLPTPSGWTKMGEVEVGDQLLDGEGRPTRVVALSPVWEDRPCYRVRVRGDEGGIVADAAHVWVVSRRNYGWALSETDQILLNEKVGVPWTPELVLPELDLPVHPYILGVWLGDGSVRDGVLTGSASDRFVLDRCVELWGSGEVRIYGTQATAHLPGISGHLTAAGARLYTPATRRALKRIPAAYLRASAEQRREVLAGIMDTDGLSGRVVQVSQNKEHKEIAYAAAELARSLGLVAWTRQKTKRFKGHPYPIYVTHIAGATRAHRIFRLPRKQNALPEQRSRYSTQAAAGKIYATRRVLAVEPVPSVAVRCLQVDHPRGVFLAGREMVPTHNSWMALQIGWAIASGGYVFGGHPTTQGRVVYMALEDTPRRLQHRLATMLGPSEPPHELGFATQWPTLNEGGYDKLERTLQRIPVALVIVDVFIKLRSHNGERRQSAYEADYMAVNPYRALFDRYGTSFLLVHHTRKVTATDGRRGDWLELISGSQGLAAAADAVLLTRRARETGHAEMHVTGRDLEERRLVLAWDSAIGAWRTEEGAGEPELAGQVLAVLTGGDVLTEAQLAARLGVAGAELDRTLKRLAQQKRVRRSFDGFVTLQETSSSRSGPE